MNCRGVVVVVMLVACMAQAQISVVLAYGPTSLKMSSSPGDFVQLGDKTLFTSSGPAGSELWAITGRFDQPELLWSSQLTWLPTTMTQLVVAKGAVWFATDEGVWTSDGTRDGTRLALARSLIESLETVDDRLFFSQDFPLFGSRPGTIVWSETDGTETGTHVLADLLLGKLRRCGSTIYALKEGYNLWATDLTAAGTLLLSSQHNNWVCAAGQAYFTVRRELWTTDGTVSGTRRVGLTTDSNGSLVAAGTKVFFSGYSPDSGVEPWVSDGTVEGTHEAADLMPGPNSSLGNALGGVALDGGAVFAIYAADWSWQLGWTDGVASAHWQDGLPGLAKPIPAGFVNGELVVSATSDAGPELWIAGENSARQLASGTFHALLQVQGGAFVSFDTPDAGIELWWTDGTAAGTTMVFDPTPNFVTTDMRRSFTAQGVLCATFVGQRYLCLDGDAGVPRMLDFQIDTLFEDTPRGRNAFIHPDPYTYAAVRLLADGGYEPIGPNATAFDGFQILETPAGTVFTTTMGVGFEDGGMIRIPSSEFEYPQHLALRDGALLVSTPTTLYSIDLTPDASLTRIASARGIFDLAALRSGEIVAIDYGDLTGVYNELRAIHPDGGSTTLIYLPDSGVGLSLEYTTPDLAYVLVANGTTELWRTDGTAEGTYALSQLGYPQYFNDYLDEGTLFFVSGAGRGSSIFATEGTRESTRLLRAGVGASWVKRVDGTIYADCWTSDAGYELCTLEQDGGMQVVQDVFPGLRSSRPQWPRVTATQIVWQAETPSGMALLGLPRSLDAGAVVDGKDAGQGTDGGLTTADGGSDASDAGTETNSKPHGCGCNTSDALALQTLWLLAALRRRSRQ